MSDTVLWVDLPRLDPDGEKMTGGLDAKALEMAPDDPLVRSAGRLHYDLRLEIIAHELLVRGRVRTRVAFACSRCAEWSERDVEVPDFFFSTDISDVPEGVDLTPPLREAIMLSLPAYPLCRSACKGLCPQCGCNLNNGTCECAPPSDRRWNVLDDL